MRNAVKKRMLKLRQQQQPQQQENGTVKLPSKKVMNKFSNVLKSDLEVTKYPKGSCILFTASYMKGEKPATVSCSWYNKTGINSKNTVFKPAEWQNITIEEMDKICQMFDEHLYMPLVYV